MQAAASLLGSQPSNRYVVSHNLQAFVCRHFHPFNGYSIRRPRASTTAQTTPSLHFSSRSWQSQQSRPFSPLATAARILDARDNIKDFTAKYPVSIWSSTSNNPYHNLAIENYLLKYSDPSSRILFTYTNRPCVVIGRNQNPWLECNIASIQEGLLWRREDWAECEENPDSGTTENARRNEGKLVSLDLVRRRSGGGTVIHDAGNLNFSFIVPNDKTFTRDKHGQMVVQVLREYKEERKDMEEEVELLYDTVRVNERHDIVMTRKQDTSVNKQEFKASGSAFKLTRGRALHHGTLLHSSPNVKRSHPDKEQKGSVFSALLTSPAKPYLEAKGVGSVRSPVHNLFHVLDTTARRRLSTALEERLRATLRKEHGHLDIPVTYVGDEVCQQDVSKDIYDDIQELMTDDWRFCQTPTFEYSSEHIDSEIKMSLQVKHGVITKAATHAFDGTRNEIDNLVGKKLHEIQDWQHVVPVSAVFSDHLASVFPLVRQNRSETDLSVSNNNDIIEETPMKKSSQGDIAVERRSTQGTVEVEEAGESVVVER